MFTTQMCPLTMCTNVFVPVDSSESSGESVSGFSSSSHSFHSAIGGDVEDTPSAFASVIIVKEAAVADGVEASAVHKQNAPPGSPENTPPPVAPKPTSNPQSQADALPSSKVQSSEPVTE